VADLSLLCVTRGEPHAAPFVHRLADLQRRLQAELVLICDGQLYPSGLNGTVWAGLVHSQGYIESVLDEAVGKCSRDYVLRLDDDEACSKAMVDWLAREEYQTAQHWKFPRVHLWGDTEHALVTPQLWPDHQTRLSLRSLAGGRRAIHAGSPYGGGIPAPCAIEHWKFLVRSLPERREIVDRYDAIQPGAGSRFRAFSVPEDFYTAEELAAAVRTWDGRMVKG
jgi:hypothetical protein